MDNYPKLNTYKSELNNHKSEFNYDIKYRNGYIGISVVIGLILIAIGIMIFIMWMNSTYIFANYIPTPKEGTGLYQANIEYYNATLTPEQIQKKQEMINAAKAESNVS